MDVLKGEGAKISITGKIPGTPSFQDFDVQFGKDPMTRDASKASTFQNALETGGNETGDARFNKAAALMGSTGDEIIGASEAGRTYMEKKEEAAIEP